ncbi:MAG TPA: Crp/Fnr family transcriptional regulator [Chitinophagaceae bacterium]|nr:Crp/Fnr family transcriptional regulator [Chitinophagaceae bacterium]
MNEKLNHLFPLKLLVSLLPGEVAWEKYAHCFIRMEAPAKTILLKEGEVSKKAYMIEQGCVRAWFNNAGKDVTAQFFFENSTVSSLESFKKNIPSLVTIETLEPCILWYVHKPDFEKIIDEIGNVPALRKGFMDVVFNRTFHYMKHFLSFIKDSPKQRYLNLVNENPQIILRVPQHYIASYLGISSVHLSRIKNAIARENKKRSI